MDITKENYFTQLSKLGVELSKKGKFSYGSWADVWDTLKMNVNDAQFEWIENDKGTLGLVDDYGCFAKVRVWSESLGVNTTMYLHAMDYSNKAVRKDNLTATEINKAYQRCMVKAIAVGFGFGLYVYRGEDLPEKTDGNNIKPKEPYKKAYFNDLAEAFNEGGNDVASELYKAQAEVYEMPVEKAKKLGEIYKANQNISKEDIDEVWNNREAVKKEATG